MIVININERKYYIYKRGYYTYDNYSPEYTITEMFEEHFNSIYKRNAVRRRLDEIWEKISMQIPENSIFVEKDSILYCINSSLEFEIVPKDIFEIDESAHPVLIECFEKCYSEFKNLIENYRNWESENDENVQNINSIGNVFLKTSGYKDTIEDLSITLANAKEKFSSILNVSLKDDIACQLSDKIVEVYKSALLQDNPIMLITKKQGYIKKIYAVTENLEVREVEYFLIEREIEEIVYEVIPEDADFLGNRIYNFMMFPLCDVKPYIRINKVQRAGINATIFLKEKDIPVICDLELKCFYAFLKINHNDGFPTSKQIRYDKDMISVTPLSPERGIRIFLEFDETIFNEMLCYIEHSGKKYEFYDYNRDSEHKLLYRMNNGNIEPVYNESRIRYNSEASERFEKTMKSEIEDANKQGIYSFWEIKFEPSE